MKVIDLNKTKRRRFIFKRPGRWQIIFRNLSGRLNFEIRSRGVNLEINGFYHGKSHDQFRLQTNQHHIAPHSHSNLTIKGVLDQHARFFHQGWVKIEKTAKDSEAHQQNRSLLLSPNCSVESQPFLEILNHQVVCSHAVSIAAPDSEEQFFLQSRGITKKKSRKLIVEEFLRQ